MPPGPRFKSALVCLYPPFSRLISSPLNPTPSRREVQLLQEPVAVEI
jgi:hypothetical protein